MIFTTRDARANVPPSQGRASNPLVAPEAELGGAVSGYLSGQMVAEAVAGGHERLEAARETFARRAELTDADWWAEVQQTGEWWQW